MKFNFIVAVSEDDVIGNNNTMLWYIKEDLQYFRKITEGHAVVMGRKTFDSIGRKPLSNRFNIVLSRSDNEDKNNNVLNLEYTNSIKNIINITEKNNYDSVFVIGGSEIYNLFLQEQSKEKSNFFLEKIYYTRVFGKYACDNEKDCFFPNNMIDWSSFFLESARKSENEKCEFLVYRNQNLIEKKHEERQYLELIEKVLKKKSLNSFGEKMEFDLSQGFPLLTSKKVFWKAVIHELLWFLSGSTNSKVLSDNGVKIWEANSSREYLDSVGLHDNEEYDLGPVYGFQMRHFGGEYKNNDSKNGFDQIDYIVNMIKTKPESRRILMSLWNPSQLHQQALPPCHLLYHFRCDEENNQLHLCMYQRSGDIGLGVPFNIASSSLLLSIISKLTNRKVGKFTHFLGDSHIYPEHVKALKTQLQNNLYPFPILKIKDRSQEKVEDFRYEDFLLFGYRSNKIVKMPIVV